MKKSTLAKLAAVTLLTIASISHASEATLTSRYTGGDYTTATYSFRFMSQDINVTKNNVEILFEGRADFEKDYFVVNTVVDDNNLIYDLGEKSCADISSSYPAFRQSRPLVWLGYSEASPLNKIGTKTAPVTVGHCYLAYNNDESGRVVTLFHVASAEKNKSVTINEIEVLNSLTSN